MGKVLINRNGKSTVDENSNERSLKKGETDGFDVVINGGSGDVYTGDGDQNNVSVSKPAKRNRWL